MSRKRYDCLVGFDRALVTALIVQVKLETIILQLSNFSIVYLTYIGLGCLMPRQYEWALNTDSLFFFNLKRSTLTPQYNIVKLFQIRSSMSLLSFCVTLHC